MEDNKKSQNQPYNDDPRKTTLIDQPSDGDNSSFVTDSDLFDSEGEDFINLTEIVDTADRLEGTPLPGQSSTPSPLDDEFPIDLEDMVPVNEADLASGSDQLAVDENDTDLIDLLDIVPVEEIGAKDAPAMTDVEGDEDDELIELTDSVSFDGSRTDEMASVISSIRGDVGSEEDDIVDLTDRIETNELKIEPPVIEAMPEDEDEIIDLTDTVWPKEPEETADADEMDPLEPAVVESDSDDFGDAFIDITDIDITDLQIGEEAPISSDVNEDGEEEDLELADYFSMDAISDPSSAMVETMDSESNLSEAEPSGVNETTDDEFTSSDQIEGIDLLENPADDDEGRIEEDITDLNTITEIAESEVTSSLEDFAGEDLSDLSEYKDEAEAAGISDIEIPKDTTDELISEQNENEAVALLEIEEPDNASSPIELTEQVDDQKPVILLEDEIVTPQSTLLEEIHAVLGEKEPSLEASIPVAEEPILDDAPEVEEAPSAVFNLDSDTQPPMDTMDEAADEEPPAIDSETAETPQWDSASAMDLEPATEEAIGIDSDELEEQEADKVVGTDSVLDIEMLETMMSDTFSGDDELINLDDVLGRGKDDITNEMDEADQPIEDDAEIDAPKASNDFTIGIALDEIDMENEGLSVSQDEIETAVERVIQKKYGQTIEQLIATTVEKMVSQEIESIRRSMLEDEDPTD